MLIEVWHNVVTSNNVAWRDVTSVIGMGSIQTWSILLHKLHTPYINQFVTNYNQQIPEMSTPVRSENNIWHLYPIILYLDRVSIQMSEPPFFPTWDVSDSSIKYLSPAFLVRAGHVTWMLACDWLTASLASVCPVSCSHSSASANIANICTQRYHLRLKTVCCW